jgi:hypothetical protein
MTILQRSHAASRVGDSPYLPCYMRGSFKLEWR